MQQVYWEVEYFNGNVASEDIISPTGDGGYYENMHQRKDIKYLSLITPIAKFTFNMQTGSFCGIDLGKFHNSKNIKITNQNVYYEPIQFKEAFFIDDGATQNPQVFTKTFNIGWKANFDDFVAKAILTIDGVTFEPMLTID